MLEWVYIRALSSTCLSSYCVRGSIQEVPSSRSWELVYADDNDKNGVQGGTAKKVVNKKITDREEEPAVNMGETKIMNWCLACILTC